MLSTHNEEVKGTVEEVLTSVGKKSEELQHVLCFMLKRLLDDDEARRLADSIVSCVQVHHHLTVILSNFNYMTTLLQCTAHITGICCFLLSDQ